MFRGLDNDSDLGREFLSYSTKGLLVPDELTIRMWKRHVQGLIDDGRYGPASDLLVLDGIPRSIPQAEALDVSIEVVQVLHLVAPDVDSMVARMKKRALEQNRPDDADESVIRKRFAVSSKETHPVLEHYDGGLVAEIDAMGTPVEVFHRVLGAVIPVYRNRFGNPLE